MPAKGSSLESWLSYISSVHPREIELGLDRTRRVADRLNLGKPAPRVITVAGTNGKGSCVATLEAILQRAGYKTGCYTSPHIHSFNERIRIDGLCVTDSDLIAAFEAIEARRDDETLSYFEFATLAGLYLFRESGVDVALLEVGLGGRLDAVNIIDADVAIISSIGIDHVDWLGEDIESIAAEKAGIMRPGMPVVFGGDSPPAAITARADEIGAPLLLAGRDFRHVAATAAGQWHWFGQRRDGSAVEWRNLPTTRLLQANVVAALQALMLLPLSIERRSLSEALAQVRLMGRFELRRDSATGRAVICDVAHNPAAMQQLAILLERYSAQNQGRGRLAVVLAAMADKDVRGMITALESCVDIWYIAQVDQARSMAAHEVAQILKSVGKGANLASIDGFSSAETAYEAACAQTGAEDTVLVTGSFYTVAAVHARSEQV